MSYDLYLARHGATEWSLNGRHTGITDLPLLPEGEEEARRLRPRLAEAGVKTAFVSDRGRARRTAELAGFPEAIVTPLLREADYGDYEGLTSPEIRRTEPGWTIFSHGAPHGETIEQVTARADRVITRVLPYLERGPVVLFSHGHMSRVLGTRWIGLPVADGAKLKLGTAAPSLLGAQYGSPAIMHWNIPNPAGGES